jgi:hypothetical protein
MDALALAPTIGLALASTDGRTPSASIGRRRRRHQRRLLDFCGIGGLSFE